MTDTITIHRDPTAYERAGDAPNTERPPHRKRRYRKPEHYKVEALREFARTGRTKAKPLVVICDYLGEYMQWAEQ